MVVTATQILKKLEVDLNTFQIGQNDTFSTQIYKIDIIVGTFSMNMTQHCHLQPCPTQTTTAGHHRGQEEASGWTVPFHPG